MARGQDESIVNEDLAVTDLVKPRGALHVPWTPRTFPVSKEENGVKLVSSLMVLRPV